MKKAADRIKQAWDENPLTVIVVASGAVLAAAKMLDAVTAAKNANSWKKEVERRNRKHQK